MGYLQTIQDALDVTRSWMTGLKNPSKHADVLTKIKSATECFKIPLGALVENIESLQRQADNGKLTTKAKLSYMLGESEMKLMDVHLNRMVMAMTFLLAAAQSKTQQERDSILDNAETRTVLTQIEDDSASYMRREPETASVLTATSVPVESDAPWDSTFAFDRDLLASVPYMNAHTVDLADMDAHSLPQLDHEHEQHQQESQLQTTPDSSLPVIPRVESSGPISIPFEDWFEMSSIRPETSPQTGADPADEGCIEAAAVDVRPGSSSSSRSTATAVPASVAEARAAVSIPEDPAQHQTAASASSSDSAGFFRTQAAKSNGSAPSRSDTSDRWLGLRRSRDLTLTARPKNDRTHEAVPKKKVFLLGAGTSGKDALLKNFRLKYDKPFSKLERENYRDDILSNVAWATRIILEAMETLDIPLDEPNMQEHVNTVYMHPTQISDFLPQDLGEAILALRECDGFQACMARSSEFVNILDASAPYLLHHLERIAQRDYEPTIEDIIHAYRPTPGGDDNGPNTVMIIRNREYEIANVGGFRAIRKQWPSPFERMSVVLFTVDISEYDLLLVEDDTRNRMQESLALFENVVNLLLFGSTHVILLFTKIDLFEAKLPRSPLNVHFPDYNGSTLEDAKDFIRSKFVSLDRSRKTDEAYFVCLIDTARTSKLLHTLCQSELRPRWIDPHFW